MPATVDASSPSSYVPIQQHPHYPTMYRDRYDNTEPSTAHTIDATPSNAVIDNYERMHKCETGAALIMASTPPPPPPSHTLGNSARNFNAPKKKMEESCIMLEIRNSAPDVIIMTTSH